MALVEADVEASFGGSSYHVFLEQLIAVDRKLVAMPLFGIYKRSRQNFLVGIARYMEAVAVIFYDGLVVLIKYRAFLVTLALGNERS